jgi:serine/threonine protein phosphatase PrpC
MKFSRDNTPLELTVDHKPSNPIEKQRIRDAGIEILDAQTRINGTPSLSLDCCSLRSHETGLAVSRALGDHFVKEQNLGLIAEPHISECIKIQPADTHVIIASDGVSFMPFSQHQKYMNVPSSFLFSSLLYLHQHL